jgi:hypothetical protein
MHAYEYTRMYVCMIVCVCMRAFIPHSTVTCGFMLGLRVSISHEPRDKLVSGY